MPATRHHGENGGETMRLGYSYQSMFVSRTTVEDNLFTQCDGEIEIISSKSCENVYRHNTFRDCEGTLTLRHGNRCVVDGNRVRKQICAVAEYGYHISVLCPELSTKRGASAPP